VIGGGFKLLPDEHDKVISGEVGFWEKDKFLCKIYFLIWSEGAIPKV
jgi:hypothetical protein